MNLWTSLRKNWPLKLGSLIVGLVLWAHVKTDQRYQRVVSFPLIVNEASGRFVVANEIPDDVSVRLAASGKDLLFQRPRGRVVLRPRVSQPETITYELSVDNIEGMDESENVQVIDIESPRSLVLDFDYLDTREVPVTPRVGLDLRPGYAVVGHVETVPRTVRIAGPRRYVQDMQAVETDSVVLGNVQASVATRVGLDLPPQWHLTATPNEVAVHAEVQALLERRLKDVPIVITHQPPEVDVQAVPQAVTVDLIGGAELVDGLTLGDVRVQLDYRERFEKGLDDLPLDVKLPADVRLVRVTPSTASLVIKDPRPRR